VAEKWDSSNYRGKQLKSDDFGSPGEVRKMAKPIRIANDRRETAKILKKIVQNGPMVSKSGLIARLSTKTIGKIVSNQALNTSFAPNAHYLAAANLDYLFTNAIEPWRFELIRRKTTMA
jgi:hypothetical protein